jgi:hypothetical protein
MPITPSMHAKARELFDQECQRHAGQRGDGPNIDYAPAYWLLSDLLSHQHDRETDQGDTLASIVRSRITDQNFIDSGGDKIIDNEHQLPTDQQINLVVTVLDQVRRQVA